MNISQNRRRAGRREGILQRLGAWLRKPKPLMWSIGSVLSIALNAVLALVVLALGRQLFDLKNLVTDDVLGEMYYNFILMDQASIETTVGVDTTIPVRFDLQLNQETNVRLTNATTIQNASVTLKTGGLNIVEAPTDIILPAGSVLPVELDLVVPVDTTVPVHMNVPVDIPLNETELHQPFTGLQQVVAPLYQQLAELPDSWGGIFCWALSLGCE